jgi:hypothetical protein
MSFLKSFVITLIALFLMPSCSFYTISSFQPDKGNGSDCPDPIYVGTMYKSSIEVVTISGGPTEKMDKPERLTLVSLLKDAKSKYGEDVTIHNIRYDVLNGRKKTGVIYDVVKCK